MEATPVDDAAVLARVRAGDPAAYSELYDAYADDARRYARRLASPGASADDLIAEAFTKTLSAIQGGRGPIDGFRPYLFTALRRIASRARGPHGAYPNGLDPFESHPQAAAADATDAGEVDEVVIPAFKNLPRRWQRVLWLLEIDGRTVPEAAEILGLSPNATSALAYRARRGLRTAYLDTAARTA